jgi:hypothetical protein
LWVDEIICRGTRHGTDHRQVPNEPENRNPAGRREPTGAGGHRRPPRQVPTRGRQGPSVGGQGREGSPQSNVRLGNTPRRAHDQPGPRHRAAA